MASIVVVGGGIAGLTCAWQLRRQGHDVEVLDRAAQPGGRLIAEVRHGFSVDRGARFISGNHPDLQNLLGDLDLADRVYSPSPTVAAVQRRGVLHPTGPLRLWVSRLLSPTARARLPLLAFHVLRSASGLNPRRADHAAQLERRDRVDLVTGMRPIAGDENLEFLIAPAFASAFDCEPEDLSFAFGLRALKQRARGSRPQSLRGGLGHLAEALASRVLVRVDCEVTSVETETDGARVRYRIRGRPGSVVADAVVVAVAGCRVAPLCAKLTPAEQGFFEQVRYVRGIRAHLCFETAPAIPVFTDVMFPRSEGVELYGLRQGHRQMGAAPPGGSLLTATLTAPAAKRLWRADDAEVSGFVTEQLASSPIGQLAPDECIVHRSDALRPLFPAGQLSRLARFLARMDRSPRLAFAGNYLVDPTLEGSVSSGMRAAAEVSESL
ncbi:MAG: FAD-dependent oxidoreductase [Myxococcota bacterium]